MNYPSNLRNRLEPETKKNNASIRQEKGWNLLSNGVELAVKLIIIKGQCKTRVELNWVKGCKFA